MSSADPKSHGTVLVVEDDDDVREEVRGALESHGYRVLEANDGGDALAILRLPEAPAIDVIVLDLLMPKVSGWELVDNLCGDPALSQIPAIIATAVSVRRSASGIPARMGWLCKPFGEEALLAAVREAIEKAAVAVQPGATAAVEERGRAPLPSDPTG